MKYYIDFEASDAEQRIISVGCVREDGQTFYSLVSVDDPITEYIEELTHISQEDIDNAPSQCEVFTNLFEFIYGDDNPEIMNYGDKDVDYVFNTLNYSSSFKEELILSYLYLNMIDISDELKAHFYVNKAISLAKLSLYYFPELEEQNHNALDDAILLKKVHEKMSTTKKEVNVFNEYLKPKFNVDHINSVIRLSGNTILNEFNSLDEAVKWLNEQPNDKGPSYLNDAAQKIIKAAKEGSRFFYSNWRIL